MSVCVEGEGKLKSDSHYPKPGNRLPFATNDVRLSRDFTCVCNQINFYTARQGSSNQRPINVRTPIRSKACDGAVPMSHRSGLDMLAVPFKSRACLDG